MVILCSSRDTNGNFPNGLAGKEPAGNAETQETRVRSLGPEDLLEATRSSILA